MAQNIKSAAGIAKAKDAASQADELEERLIDFAVRIIKLSASLPNTAAGRHIAGQILRSGTSPAPNYGEARVRRVRTISFTSYASFLRS
jgi:four helix bundle protein